MSFVQREQLWPFAACLRQAPHTPHTPSPRRTREHTFAREWMLQVAHALGHCHSLGVAHRDCECTRTAGHAGDLHAYSALATLTASAPTAIARRHSFAVKPENILVFPMHRPGAAATPQGKEPLVAALQQVAAGGAAAKAGTQTLHGYLLKLCDFGSALVASEGHVGPIKGHSARGSAMYACPQVCALHIGSRRPELAQRYWTPSFLNKMSSDGYDAAAADVWSWGVTVFTLVAGHLPFRTASPDSSTYRAFVLATQPEVVDDALMAPGCSEWQLTHSAMAAGSSRLAASEWSWPAAFSPALRHLLGRCLRVREGERFTMEDIKSHPWFANPRWKPSPVAPLTLPTSPPRLAILAGGPSSSTPTTQTTSGHPTSAASGAGGGMWSAAPSFQGAADRLAAPLSQSNTASTASSHDQDGSRRASGHDAAGTAPAQQLPAISSTEPWVTAAPGRAGGIGACCDASLRWPGQPAAPGVLVKQQAVGVTG